MWDALFLGKYEKNNTNYIQQRIWLEEPENSIIYACNGKEKASIIFE